MLQSPTVISGPQPSGGGSPVGSNRQINTTEGVQGGGDLSTDRTHKLDVGGLAEVTSFSGGDDFCIIYDTTSDTHYKIKVENLFQISGPTILSGTFTFTGGIAEYPKAVAGTAVNATQFGDGRGAGPSILTGNAWRAINDGQIGPSSSPVKAGDWIVALIDNATNSVSERVVFETDEISIEDILRASLNTKITDSSLIPGRMYKITDPIDGGQIVITATDVNKLSPSGTRHRTNEFRAFGFFRLSGVAGSVTAVNVLGVNQLTASIPFSTNAIQTAQNVANNINANGARVVNAVSCPGDTTLQNPYIVLERLTGGVNTDAVTVTTVTMVADDVQNMANGAVSVDVVYSVEYKFGPTPEESRIVRCYDAENSCDIAVDYQNAVTGNSISGYDVFGVKQPGFFRRGSVYASHIKAIDFNWELVFQHSNSFPGRLTVNILLVVQCLFRGLGNPSNITSSGALSFLYVTNGALASFVSNFFGPFQQTFQNQSFGNLSLTGCQFVGSQSAFTTRVTHSVGTTQLRLNAEQTTFSIITARALGGTLTQIKTGRNSVFTLNYVSTSSANSLGKIDVAGGSTFSITHTGVGALANLMNGVTIGHNSNLTMTIDGTAVTALARTIINGASHTFIAPGVLLNNFNSSNQSTAVSITSANQIDLQNTMLDNFYFRKRFLKTLTGAVNLGLSGSPIFLGNLLLNFRATKTIRKATGFVGVGALLQMGIETDDDDAMIPVESIVTLTGRRIFDAPTDSEATTADRRIIATPTIATITAGTIQGYVEGYIG